jgi:hypothetical protein
LVQKKSASDDAGGADEVNADVLIADKPQTIYPSDKNQLDRLDFLDKAEVDGLSPINELGEGDDANCVPWEEAERRSIFKFDVPHRYNQYIGEVSEKLNSVLIWPNGRSVSEQIIDINKILNTEIERFVKIAILYFNRLPNKAEYVANSVTALSIFVGQFADKFSTVSAANSDEQETLSQILAEFDNTIKCLYDRINYASDVVEVCIGVNRTGDFSKLSIADRTTMLDKFTREFPGQPISAYFKQLFPELHELTLPAASSPAVMSYTSPPHRILEPLARPRWADREPGDTPVSFVKKHYGRWRGNEWDSAGLTKTDLRHDMQLYNALTAWERRHHEDSLNLPTKRKTTQTWLEQIGRGSSALPSDKESFSAEAQARELERRAKAIRRGVARSGSTDDK